MPRGRKLGSKGKNNAEKEVLRQFLREKVAREWGSMLDAQIDQAKGLKYLVVRDKKTGKFLRVSEVRAKCAEGEEQIEVWEKDPSTQAFDSLANRTIGKPAETIEGSMQFPGGLTIKWEGD